jgi:uncharacterized BrkB/YihY/UPF0761 family membrane protein
MNRLVTFALLPVIVGLTFTAMIVVRFANEPTKAWQWCLVAVAALAVGLLVASLLNFAVFAPIYWLLGRRPKRRQYDDRKT